MKLHIETDIVHGIHTADSSTGAHSMPIYQTSTFCFKNAEHGGRLFKDEEKGYTGQPLDYAPLYKAVGKHEDFEIRWKCTIFSHEFAKAFWGEDIINIDFKQTIKDKNYKKVQTIILQDKAWRFHVSEMVKCEEPLKYLAKFLDNEE